MSDTGSKTVWELGSRVEFVDGGVVGVIDAIAVYRHGGILYNVVWWNNGSRENEWVSEDEILNLSHNPRVVGFGTYLEPEDVDN